MAKKMFAIPQKYGNPIYLRVSAIASITSSENILAINGNRYYLEDSATAKKLEKQILEAIENE